MNKYRVWLTGIRYVSTQVDVVAEDKDAAAAKALKLSRYLEWDDHDLDGIDIDDIQEEV